MDERLAEWLSDNRPYTHLGTRLKHFILFCRTLQPGLSYSTLKKEVTAAANRILRGDLGRRWMRDRCYERVLRMYGANDQRTDAWHAKRMQSIMYGIQPKGLNNSNNKLHNFPSRILAQQLCKAPSQQSNISNLNTEFI